MSPTNNPFSVTRGALKKQFPVTTLFEADPMIHPNVLDAYEQAFKVLKDHDIAFTLKGDDLVELLNSKLASYLSARDRLRDASDVQSLVSKHALPLEFESQLAPAVRSAYRRIWCGEM